MGIERQISRLARRQPGVDPRFSSGGMPVITKIQKNISRVLILNCQRQGWFTEGWLAGGIKSIKSREEIFKDDIQILEKNNFFVQVLEKHAGSSFWAVAKVYNDDGQTQMIWSVDRYRFFPPQKHPEFGYYPHEPDSLIDKIFAFVFPRSSAVPAVQEYFDLCCAWKNKEPVIECLFAAPAYESGYTPEVLLGNIYMSCSRYSPKMFKSLELENPPASEEDLIQLIRDCGNALIEIANAAQVFFDSMPNEEKETLFLKKDTLEPFLPSAEDLRSGDLIRNRGRECHPAFLPDDWPKCNRSVDPRPRPSRRGAWPWPITPEVKTEEIYRGPNLLDVFESDLQELIDSSQHLTKKELFEKLRLGGRSWINMPLEGIKEAADMAESYVQQFPLLFRKIPPRSKVDDTTFVSYTISGLKRGNLYTIRLALKLISFLESKNPH